MSQFSPEVTEKLLLIGGGAVSLDHMSILGGGSTAQPSVACPYWEVGPLEPSVDCRHTCPYWEVGSTMQPQVKIDFGLSNF